MSYIAFVTKVMVLALVGMVGRIMTPQTFMVNQLVMELLEVSWLTLMVVVVVHVPAVHRWAILFVVGHLVMRSLVVVSHLVMRDFTVDHLVMRGLVVSLVMRGLVVDHLVVRDLVMVKSFTVDHLVVRSLVVRGLAVDHLVVRGLVVVRVFVMMVVVVDIKSLLGVDLGVEIVGRELVRCELVLLTVQGQRLIGDIVVLNTVLGPALNLMEKLVVGVLDVVHEFSTPVVVDVVAIDIAGVVVVLLDVVAEIFVLLVMVVVVVTSPEGCADVVGVFKHGVAVVVLSIFLGVVAELKVAVVHIVFVMVRRGVLFAVVKDILDIGLVRLEQGQFLVEVPPLVMVTVKLIPDILVVDNLAFVLDVVAVFSFVVEASVLVGPEELLVAWDFVGVMSLGFITLRGLVFLDTVGVVADLLVREAVVLQEPCVEVGSRMLERGLVQMADLRGAVNRQVVPHSEDFDLRVVSLGGHHVLDGLVVLMFR